MTKSAALTTFALAVSALLLFGCGKSQRQQAHPPAPAAAEVAVSGAGATFPAPIYARWAEAYKEQTGASLNYYSAGGMKHEANTTFDFDASDEPLKPDDLDKNGLYQFPTVLGGVVPLINLPGVLPGQVKLTGPLLADIYLGAVTNWCDPKIAALNSDVKLPNLPITVVHRADGSGTSFLFTSYLATKSPAWAQKVGAGEIVPWPTGIGGKGNDGVAALVRQTPGAIGYVQFAYATQDKLTYAILQNHDGAFVTPSTQAFAAAAAGVDWAKAPGNYLLLIDRPGGQTWPITGATFIRLHRKLDNTAKGKAVLTFFDWAYKNGDATAVQMDYAPLPAQVKDMVRNQWATTIKGPDGAPVYTGS
jgi:phosphate transport system substrate-binding protein